MYFIKFISKQTITQYLLFQLKWIENIVYLNFAEKNAFIFRILFSILEYAIQANQMFSFQETENHMQLLRWSQPNYITATKAHEEDDNKFKKKIFPQGISD